MRSAASFKSAAVRAQIATVAFARQFLGHCSAQSFAGRRNDGHSATQPQIHLLPQSKTFMFSWNLTTRQIPEAA
jgi:hypothetical protein